MGTKSSLIGYSENLQPDISRFVPLPSQGKPGRSQTAAFDIIKIPPFSALLYLKGLREQAFFALKKALSPFLRENAFFRSRLSLPYAGLNQQVQRVRFYLLNSEESPHFKL
jgi:hypothetical protein